MNAGAATKEEGGKWGMVLAQFKSVYAALELLLIHQEK